MPHTHYMLRCLALAEKALGRTGTNPMVGSVVVHQDRIIGEGYHRFFGGHHAEVEAIASVQQPELLRDATLYVNLEPCSHFGKTPPCADLIIKHQIPRVVYGMTDPNPLVAGRGLKLLQEASVEVIGPVLEEKCQWLNRRFVQQFQSQRPWVVLKWAQTQDGFIDKARTSNDKGSYAISGPLAQSLVHHWRAQEMGILIGVQTALNDIPQLSIRYASGPQPLRIVLDPNNRLPNDHPLCLDGLPLLRITIGDPMQSDAQCLYTEAPFNLNEILHQLYVRGIASILVEGGRRTLESFISLGLWDEARVFTSPKRLLHGLQAPRINKKPLNETTIGVDKLETFLA